MATRGPDVQKFDIRGGAATHNSCGTSRQSPGTTHANVGVIWIHSKERLN